MPTAATTAGGTRQETRQRGQAQQVMPVVPFIRASAEHREPAGIDISRQLTTSDQDLGVFDVPAYGYVRRIVLVVTASGGTGGAPNVTTPEDSPHTTLKQIALTEPNGAVLSQFNTGYDLHLANKWGGYRHALGADFRASPTFTMFGTTFASYQYMTSIPVEINLRDGLGALPNQNAAATFKLKLTLAKVADIAAGTLPTTLPTVRIRAYAECWDQPETSTGGATNQITPPAMNTTQFWTSQTYQLTTGQNTIRLTRVGNYLRNLIFILRDNGSRANGEADWADPTTIYLDTRPLDIIENNNWKHQMYERTGYGAQYATASAQVAPAADLARSLDNGVRVYDFMHEFDGTLGMENRDLWLPTLGSTRLEVQGVFGTLTSGTLTVLTNDVAIAGSVFM
jgi:hypothetical protein